jgi:uncharacterized protein YecT (DUF1311 family)
MHLRMTTLSTAAIVAALMSPLSMAKDCEKDTVNMAEVRACAADQMEKRLDDTFNATLAFVRAKDPQAATLLMEAQNSWKKFASDSCEYSMAARQTAQMENDARSMCWGQFINARVNVLNNYRRDFGNPDALNGPVRP